MNVEQRLQRILCDLLLLEPEAVQPGSLLVSDLDVDSITMLELAFTVEKEFGVAFPDVKASEETFNLLLPEALQRLEAMPGGTTFFEYIKEEAIRQALGRTVTSDRLDEATRDRIFRQQSVDSLARAVGGRAPDGVDQHTPVSALRLVDLFQFLTVGAMARYIEYLMSAPRR